MSKLILTTSKYVTQDKKIPTMKSVLVSDGILSASADDFILKELITDAEVLDMKGTTLVPGFIDCYSDFLGHAKKIASDKGTDLPSAIKLLSDLYIQAGFCTVVQRNCNSENLLILKEAGEKGYLGVDVAVYLNESDSELLPQQMPMDNLYENHVRLAGVSVLVDDLVSTDTLSALICPHIEKHQQIAFTANSKKAIETCMTSYRNALIAINGSKTDEDGNEKPKIFEDLRPILFGCRELASDQLTLFQSLGFIPFYDLYEYNSENDNPDSEYLVRDAVRRGLAFGLVQSMDEPNAFKTMNLAVNRCFSTSTYVSEQTINCDQALLGNTLFCAYAIFEDLYKGSLTMSKKADFVVLNENPLEISDGGILGLKVVATLKDGNVVYKG